MGRDREWFLRGTSELVVEGFVWQMSIWQGYEDVGLEPGR